MKIFIGSSTKHLDIAEKLAQVIESLGHTAKLWTYFFAPTDITFEKIMSLSNEVDGGIFVLAPDDEVVSSDEKSEFIPRDNVLIEAGILFGQLGKPHVALCRVENTKIASDWSGITYIPYVPEKIHTLKNDVREWLTKVQESIDMKKESVNDYLSDTFPDFKKLVSSANEEILISSYFISIFQTSGALKDAIRNGIKVRLLLSDYRGDSLLATAKMLDGINTDAKRVKTKLASTLYEFAALYSNNGLPDNLEVRFIDCVFPKRTTIIDPVSVNGNMYVHLSSYKNKDAPQATFHLVSHENWFKIYYDEFEQMWNEARPIDFEELKSLSM